MTKKTLVLGASLNTARYSNKAIHSLRKHDVVTVAVGLRSGKVLDVEIHKGITDFEDIHTVTLYLNPQRQEEYYDYIINLEPQRVIFNPGTENPALYAMLHEHQIEVEIACTLVMLGTRQY
jgi:hypothetical protein